MATEKSELEAGDQLVKLDDVVKFKVNYAKDFAGTKFMKQDQVYTLHRLHAERLEKKGIGKIQ